MPVFTMTIWRTLVVSVMMLTTKIHSTHQSHLQYLQPIRVAVKVLLFVVYIYIIKTRNPFLELEMLPHRIKYENMNLSAQYQYQQHQSYPEHYYQPQHHLQMRQDKMRSGYHPHMFPIPFYSPPLSQLVTPKLVSTKHFLLF